MSIKFQRVNSEASMRKVKAPLCFTCKERPSAVVTMDANGNPICPNCAGRKARFMIQRPSQPDED